MFVILFVVAFAALGELIGSFADADRVFVDHFSDGGNRARDIAGSYLLVVAGLSLVWFAHVLPGGTEDRRHTPVLVTASLAAGGMILAGVAFLAVPLSISFGAVFDDPGLGEGQAVLPQFGYVALAVGAMIPAAAFVILVARTPNLLSRWLRRLSRILLK